MLVTIKAIGTKPLLLHNVALADPRNKWSKRLAELRGIRAKDRTDAILDEMEYVQFMGAFYEEIPGIGLPCENLRRSLIEAGKAKRGQSTMALRATSVTEPSTPLIFEGPKSPQDLWNDGRFKLTRMVRARSGAGPSTYPMFTEWAVRVPIELDDNLMNLAVLKDLAVRAGRIEGLGACRKLGYGRYDALVEPS